MKTHNAAIETTQVSAIVPAYNEASDIGKVLDVLSAVSRIQEIIVIDDGSTDGTGEIAMKRGAIVLRNKSRLGKGQSLQRGVREARGAVLFFCDADIEGLTASIIEKIITPVLSGDVEMSIGARTSKVRSLGFGYTYSPLLDGQRALTKEQWERVPSVQKKGYRVEVALNYHARTRMVQMFDISQTRKEEKRGIFWGTFERYAMYGDILLAHILNQLQIK